MRLFIDPNEIPDSDLQQICHAAFREFENPDQAIELVRLPNNINKNNKNRNEQLQSQSSSIVVAELFHGPTFCFKDFALQVVVQLLSYFAEQRKFRMTLLVATTGDTGPAAVRAVQQARNPRLNMLVHYPQGQISEFQRKQLTTWTTTTRTTRSTTTSSSRETIIQNDREGKNGPSCVRVVAFEGGGDDMDLPIKRILSSSSPSAPSSSASEDYHLKERSLITGINSYNIGRPLVQCVHFIWCYMNVVSEEELRNGAVVDFCLPTGAMGNLVGGTMAQHMGLPIRKLIAGTNINDISHRVIQTGQFVRSDTMHQTLSEAINIQVPYNFERILHYLTMTDHTRRRDDCLVKTWMEDELETTGRLDLTDEWLTRLQESYDSECVTDQEMCRTIRETLRNHQYLCDPHTAVALCAAEKLCSTARKIGTDGEQQQHDTSGAAPSVRVPLILLSTASPCKFEHAVKIAVGDDEWESYFNSDTFPESGRRMLQLPETPPEVYPKDPSGSLEESQRKWELRARQIIQELNSGVL